MDAFCPAGTVLDNNMTFSHTLCIIIIILNGHATFESLLVPVQMIRLYSELSWLLLIRIDKTNHHLNVPWHTDQLVTVHFSVNSSPPREICMSVCNISLTKSSWLSIDWDTFYQSEHQAPSLSKRVNKK